MSVVSSAFAPLLLAVSGLMAASYSVVGSYGVAIILFSIAITMMTFPLAAWSWRSQVAMGRLQPRLHELRRVHRNDKERFNIESAALFKEHGVSPLSGCLASLLPLPVLLAVYQAVRGLTARRAGSMLFVARHVPHGSRLWRALTSASVMRSWGIDLAQTGAAALHASPGAVGLCLLLVAATVIAGIWQQRLSSRGRMVTNGGTGTGADASAKIAPYLSGLIVIWAFALPLAVMLYYATSSVVRLGQQWLLLRLYPGT
jgi:YidC/Oxa1 family membrane protein insertase